MAFLAPIAGAAGSALASIGGGSVAAGALTVATAATGAFSAIQAKRAGQAAEQEMKIAAQREGDAARQDEIERRRDLQRALGARIAIAGAGGVTTEGSVGALARADIRNARNDLAVSRVNTAATQRALRARGANARLTGNAGAVSSLLDSGMRILEQRG